jgi:PEP-CTERM motif
MKATKYIPIIGGVLSLMLAPGAFAQVNGDEYDNSILYLPNVNVTTLNQNNFTGTVGGIFYTPYYYNTSINWLGYADPTGAALTISHTVTIWDDGTENIVAQAVVPAGDTQIYDGYAWVQLASTVTLSYQSYYAIGATVVGGVDSWGDLISNSAPDNGNSGQITWNVENGTWGGSANGPFVQAGSGWEFSRVGAYTSGSNDPDDSSEGGNRTSVQDSIYAAPNMAYDLPITPVPEPASLGLVAFGATLFAGLSRKSYRKL